MRTTSLGTSLSLSLALLLAALAAGCGDDQDPTGANDLWTQIHAAKYQSWTRAPGYETRRPTDQPHGDLVEIFVNDVVEAALAGPPITAWPEGSLIVKDQFDSDGDPDAVAAMEKRGGTWFWAEWDADGESLYSGDPGLCTGCHGSGADMVRAFGLPQ